MNTRIGANPFQAVLRAVLTLSLLGFAQIAGAQTATLSKRTFWIGVETTDGLNEKYSKWINLDRIDWIDAYLESDPVLKRSLFFIEEKGHDVPEFVALPDSNREQYTLLKLGNVPDWMELPNFEIWGLVRAGRPLTNFVYIPKNKSLSFQVRCGLSRALDRIEFCGVRASYAPDRNIALYAKLYFPDPPASNLNYFTALAARMRHVAYCLDVTHRLPIAEDDVKPVPFCDLDLLG